MKKKQYIQLFSLIFVLICLICAYKYMKSYNKLHNDSNETETLASIMNIKKDTITNICYTNNNTTMNFIKTNNIWQYADDTSMNISKNYIETILTSISKVTPLRKISNTLTSLSDFGLDQPSLIITITVSDGSTKTLYIGNKNEMTNNYYCYVEGQNQVFTVSSQLPTAFSFDLSTIKETNPETESTK